MSNFNRMKIRRLVEQKMIQEIVEADKRLKVTVKKMRIAENKMSRRGLRKSVINEDLMDIASSMLNPDAIFDVAKKYLFNGFVDMIPGIKSGGPDDLMYSFFQNLFEALTFKKIQNLFGAETCEEVISILTETITEVVLEFGAAKIVGYFVGKGVGENDSGMISFIKDKVVKGLGDVSQESVNEIVVRIIKEIVEEPVQKYICDSSLTDVIGGFFDGDEDSQGSSSELLDIAGRGSNFLSDLSGILGDASEEGTAKFLTNLGIGGK